MEKTATVQRIEYQDEGMVCVVDDGFGEFHVLCDRDAAADVLPGDDIVYEPNNTRWGFFVRRYHAPRTD